jgi:hypothetical protein
MISHVAFIPLIAEDVEGFIAALRGEGVEAPGPEESDSGATYALIGDSEGDIVLAGRPPAH